MSKKTSALRDIVTVRPSSFFRTQLQAEIAKRKTRKFPGLTNMTAGYYGPRGQQLMWVDLIRMDDGLFDIDSFRLEFIVDEFGSTFRRRANVDPFLRTVGVADYVNAGLVPELAVMLIREDMRVSEKVEQDILYRSANWENCSTKKQVFLRIDCAISSNDLFERVQMDRYESRARRCL